MRIIPALLGIARGAKREAFCNISEGTHAGSCTMVANVDITQKNLVVKVADDMRIEPAGLGDAPFGVCVDEAKAGEYCTVMLPGSASGTILCAMGSGGAIKGATLYSVADGKVSMARAIGSRKIGIAMGNSNVGMNVEVDPVGFGSSPYGIYAHGTFTWTKDASTTDTLTVTGANGYDVVYASLSTPGGAAKCVSGTAGSGNITFTLDANGVKSGTTIRWMLIRNM